MQHVLLCDCNRSMLENTKINQMTPTYLIWQGWSGRQVAIISVEWNLSKAKPLNVKRSGSINREGRSQLALENFRSSTPHHHIPHFSVWHGVSSTTIRHSVSPFPHFSLHKWCSLSLTCLHGYIKRTHGPYLFQKLRIIFSTCYSYGAWDPLGFMWNWHPNICKIK